MNGLKLNNGDWVVVCDGRKALILENSGSRASPKLQIRETHEQPASRTSEIGNDRPGRVQESANERRSAHEQPDLHDQAEQSFLATLVQRLDDAVTREETGAIVIAAAPRALGMLREAYTPGLRKAVAAEVAKDYVNVPLPEIEKRLVSD